jgi:signal transduction histidine kinase
MSLFWWFFLGWLGQGASVALCLLFGLISPLTFLVLILVQTLWTGGLFFLFRSVFKEGSGKKEGWLREFDEEIFAWKNLLREAARTQASLQKELEKWHEIIEALPFPVMLTDTHGKLFFTNTAFQKNFEAKGFCWEIPSYPFMRALEHLLQQGEGQSEPIPIRERYYSLFVSPLMENRFLVMFLERTEEIKGEEREKEFIAYAAHELKKPLTAIQGYLELMEPTLTEKQRRGFEIIVQHVSRLVRLSQDLLSLNRFELGPLSLEKCNVKDIVRRIQAIFSPRFEEKGIRFAVDVSKDIPLIEADPVALEEILVNLVENALRYTDVGEVILSVSAKDGWLSMSCQDTGIGIGEKDLPYLFDRFYVVDKSRSRQTGGTGLGLAIVKSLVLRHGGKISVQSEKGKGSTFTVELPLEQKEKPV